MNSSGVLPPQAYTREVLAKAYEWHNNQPPALRERAQSADALVALYLQAKRRAAADGLDVVKGSWESTTPASVEAFKSDLKNLAEGLKQFEVPVSAAPSHPSPPPASVAPATSRSASSSFAPEPAASSFAPPSYHPMPPPPPVYQTAQAFQTPPVPPSFQTQITYQPPPPPAPAAFQAQQAYQPPPPPAPLPNYALPQTQGLSLDARSREMARDVQTRLNLSSESDAIRVLIAIGYERVRDLFPRA